MSTTHELANLKKLAERGLLTRKEYERARLLAEERDLALSLASAGRPPRPHGVESEWDGTGWVVRPEGADVRWANGEWHTKPVDGDAEWSGRAWVPKPPDVVSQWDGSAWQPRPPGRESVWTGTQWERKPWRPSRRLVAGGGITMASLALLAAGGVLAAVVTDSRNAERADQHLHEQLQKHTDIVMGRDLKAYQAEVGDGGRWLRADAITKGMTQPTKVTWQISREFVIVSYRSKSDWVNELIPLSRARRGVVRHYDEAEIHPQVQTIKITGLQKGDPRPKVNGQTSGVSADGTFRTMPGMYSFRRPGTDVRPTVTQTVITNGSVPLSLSPASSM